MICPKCRSSNTVSTREHTCLDEWRCQECNEEFDHRDHLVAEIHKYRAVADVADVVMHHYADSLFHENSFGKMIDAMEPLRQALVNAGYGLPKSFELRNNDQPLEAV